VGSLFHGEKSRPILWYRMNKLHCFFVRFSQAPRPQELGGTPKGFILKYKEQVAGISDFIEVNLPTRARQHTLENLKVFTLYGIKVAAVNEKGPGPYTPVYNVTTGERGKYCALAFSRQRLQYLAF